MAECGRIERLTSRSLRFSKPTGEPTPAHSKWRKAEESNPRPCGPLRFSRPAAGHPTELSKLVRPEGFEPITAALLRRVPPTVGLRAQTGAAGRTRTDTERGLSPSSLPLDYSRVWWPVRVLTPHFRVESAASRPLDERAEWKQATVSIRVAGASKAPLRADATCQMEASQGVDPCPTRFRASRAQPGRLAKLVPVGRDRTSVSRLQGGCPATERYRHGGNIGC